MAFEDVEARTLVEHSLKDQVENVRTWAANLSETLGLNRYAAEQQVAISYVMQSSMGASKEKALEMGKAITMLAADVASFYNLDPQRAMKMISSGLVGESEPLKQIGVILNEGVVRAHALEAGFIQLGETLTDQQKVQARWISLQKQTQFAMGDLARTINSPVNQLRMLKARFMEAAISIGRSMLPYLQSLVKVVPLLSKVLKAVSDRFAESTEAFRLTTVIIVALIAALGPLVTIYGSTLGVMGKVLGAISAHLKARAAERVAVQASTVAEQKSTASKLANAAASKIRSGAIALGTARTKAGTAATIAWNKASALSLTSITSYGKGLTVANAKTKVFTAAQATKVAAVGKARGAFVAMTSAQNAVNLANKGTVAAAKGLGKGFGLLMKPLGVLVKGLLGLAAVLGLPVTGPALAVTALLVGLGTAFVVLYKKSDSFRDVINTIAAFLKNVFLRVWAGFVDKIYEGVEWFKELAGGAETVGEAMSNIMSYIPGWDLMVDAVKAGTDWMKEFNQESEEQLELRRGTLELFEKAGKSQGEALRWLREYTDEATTAMERAALVAEAQQLNVTATFVEAGKKHRDLMLGWVEEYHNAVGTQNEAEIERLGIIYEQNKKIVGEKNALSDWYAQYEAARVKGDTAEMQRLFEIQKQRKETTDYVADAQAAALEWQTRYNAASEAMTETYNRLQAAKEAGHLADAAALEAEMDGHRAVMGALMEEFAANENIGQRIADMKAEQQEAAKKLTDEAAKKAEAERMAQFEAKAHADEVAKIVDTLAGADMGGEVKKLTEAWRELTPEQQESERVLARLDEEIAGLHAQGAKFTGFFQERLGGILNATIEVIDATEMLGQEVETNIEYYDELFARVEAIEAQITRSDIADAVRAIGEEWSWTNAEIRSSEDGIRVFAENLIETGARPREALEVLRGTLIELGYSEEEAAKAAAELTEEMERQKAAGGELAVSNAAAARSANMFEIAVESLAAGANDAFSQAVGTFSAMINAFHEDAEGKMVRSFSNMQAGVAAFGAGMQAVGAEVGGVAGEIMSDIGGIAMAFATGGPLAGAFAVAITGVKWAVKGLKKLFGGVSEEVKKLRNEMKNFGDDIILNLQDVSTKARFDDLIGKGWREDHAKTFVWIQNAALATGRTLVEAEQLWLRYQRAVEDGNEELANSLLAQAQAWDAVRQAKNELLGLPSDQAVQDFQAIQEAWELMDADEQSRAMDNYVQSLIAARDAGIELTPVQEQLIANWENDQAIAAHTARVEEWGATLLGLPTEDAVADFLALNDAWDALDPAQQAAGMDTYVRSLIAARDAGIELTPVQEQLIANWENDQAVAAHTARVEEWGAALLGLPTEDAVADFLALNDAWDALDPEQKALGMDTYVRSLIAARDAGIELTPVQEELIANWENDQAVAAHTARVEEWGATLLGLPTGQAVADFLALNDAWNQLDPEQQAAGMDTYVRSLISARDAGIELTPVQEELIANWENDQAVAAHTARVEEWGATLLGLPTEDAVADFLALNDAWDALDPAQQAAGMDTYVRSLIAARDAGIELTPVQEQLIANWENDQAVAAHTARVEEWGAALLGLPTEDAVADFLALNDAWDALDPEQQAAGMDTYVRSLISARDAGIELTPVQEQLIANWENDQAVAAHTARVEEWGATLLGLPTGQAVADFLALNDAWDALDPAQQAAGMDTYVQSLVAAADAGIALTPVQQQLVDDWYAQKAAIALVDSAIGAMVSAYQKAQDAGKSAYEETMAAALEAGATQEEAAAQAAAAQQAAIDDVLQAEGEKFARIAAFEAALEAIRSGNAAGAADAARQAASQSWAAWNFALDAVGTADTVTSDVMQGNWRGTETVAVDSAGNVEASWVNAYGEVDDAGARAARAAEQQFNQRVRAAKDAYSAEVAAARDAYDEIVAAAEAALDRAKSLHKEQVAAANAAYDARVTAAEAAYDQEIAAAEAAASAGCEEAERTHDCIEKVLAKRVEAAEEAYAAEEAAAKEAYDSIAVEAEESYASAVAAAEAAYSAITENLRAMESAADHFGLSVRSLGADYERNRLIERLQETKGHMDALVAGGADITAAVRSMSEEGVRHVQELVDESSRLGVALPESMRKLIEAMNAEGLLENSGLLAFGDDAITAAERARYAAIEAAEQQRDAEIAAAESSMTSRIAAAESTRDAEIEAAQAARDSATEAYFARVDAAQAARDAEIAAAGEARDAEIAAADEMLEAAQATYESVTAAAEEARDAAIAAAEATRDASIAAAEATRDAGVAAVETTRDVTVAATETTRDVTVAAAEETRDKVVTTAEEARDAAVAAAEETRDKVVTTAEEARDAAVAAAEETRDKVVTTAEEARDAAIAAADDVLDNAKRVYAEIVVEAEKARDKQIAAAIAVRDAAIAASDETLVAVTDNFSDMADAGEEAYDELISGAHVMRNQISRAAADMRNEVQRAFIQLRQTGQGAMIQLRTTAQGAMSQMATSSVASVNSIIAALDRIPRSIDTTHTVTTVHTDEGQPLAGAAEARTGASSAATTAAASSLGEDAPGTCPSWPRPESSSCGGRRSKTSVSLLCAPSMRAGCRRARAVAGTGNGTMTPSSRSSPRRSARSFGRCRRPSSTSTGPATAEPSPDPSTRRSARRSDPSEANHGPASDGGRHGPLRVPHGDVQQPLAGRAPELRARPVVTAESVEAEAGTARRPDPHLEGGFTAGFRRHDRQHQYADPPPRPRRGPREKGVLLAGLRQPRTSARPAAHQPNLRGCHAAGDRPHHPGRPRRPRAHQHDRRHGRRGSDLRTTAVRLPDGDRVPEQARRAVRLPLVGHPGRRAARAPAHVRRCALRHRLDPGIRRLPDRRREH